MNPLHKSSVKTSDIKKAVNDIKNIYVAVRESRTIAPNIDDFEKALNVRINGHCASKKDLIEIFRVCDKQYGQRNFGIITQKDFETVVDALFKQITDAAKLNTPKRSLDADESSSLSIVAASLIHFSKQQLVPKKRMVVG